MDLKDKTIESIPKIMASLNADFKDGVYTKDDYRDNMLLLYDIMGDIEFDEGFNAIILEFIKQLREDFKDGIYTKKEYKIQREKLIEKISKAKN